VDSRILILAIPSALIFVALIWHSLAALPRRRAIAFWVAVIVYGVLRGFGVRFVTETIGASFPYEIRNPLLSIGGVSAQEVVGWAIVVYLAWWIGGRWKYLFAQVALASIFLGAIAWAIEAAAIAARWWHWTVPTASRVFMNVPAIGIVDWFFVGIDFLLPFAAITAGWRWRYFTLLFFPAHFAGHLLPGIYLHVVHWALVLIVAALALRTSLEDKPFLEVRAWVPTAAFAAIMLDVAFVQVFVAGQPKLLVSLVPASLIWVGVLRGARLQWLRRHWAAALIAIAVFAVGLHWKSLRDRDDMTRRLDAAIALRNSGQLASAVMELESIARDHPTSYAPFALAGEIYYRRGEIDAARSKYERAVEIKQDFVRGYRVLAVIDRQRGIESDWAKRGREVDPADIQLRYLAGEDVSPVIHSPADAAGMVALAYEVGDGAGAARFAAEGRARWPSDARLAEVSRRLGL
jgi:hypothetical protein